MTKVKIDCEKYWQEIPIGSQNAIDYTALCAMWNCRERTVRLILHELSRYDNGDGFVLIRSGKNKGFYRTSDRAEIESYRKECLNKGRSLFAPLKKCNRILSIDENQMWLELNLFNNK